MHRRLAAPESIVIHRRQVVVNERVAVNALQRRRDPQGGALRGAQQTGRLHHQERPQPLSAVEDAVPHGGEQLSRAGDFALKHGV